MGSNTAPSLPPTPLASATQGRAPSAEFLLLPQKSTLLVPVHVSQPPSSDTPTVRVRLTVECVCVSGNRSAVVGVKVQPAPSTRRVAAVVQYVGRVAGDSGVPLDCFTERDEECALAFCKVIGALLTARSTQAA